MSTILEQVEKILTGEKTVKTFDELEEIGILSYLKKAVHRANLSANNIIVSLDKKKKHATIIDMREDNSQPKAPKPKSAPTYKRGEYIPPKFAEDVRNILSSQMPQNVWLTGPTGCGKTHFVHYLAEQMGYELYQINCRADMESASFLGDKTVEIDESTGQNYITFKDGPVVQAMQTGLDENGQVIPDAHPAILFIDEAGACPAHIAIALNRLLEVRGNCREVALDDGRVIRSHPGFRIICSANTLGRGLTGASDFGYCFLNGIEAEKFLKFRDAIRAHIKSGELSTPFSTRQIIAIMETYEILKDMGKAMHYSLFSRLVEDEKQKYNETIYSMYSVDLVREFEDDEMDY